MDHPLDSPDALIRPWRTATLVASTVAAIELVVLVGVGVAFLAKPLAKHMQAQAQERAFAPVKKKQHHPVIPRTPKEAAPKLARSRVVVLVLNGNGRTGAAASAAQRLQAHDYRVGGTANARRSDYSASVVMYRRGYRPEGLRLAHDLGIRVVGPLDGMRPRDLHGAQAVIILGADE